MERENIPITFRTRPYSRRPNKKPRTNNRRHPSKEPPHSSREQRQLSNSFHRFFSSVFFAENSEVWKMINIFHIPQAIRKGHKTESFFLHLMREEAFEGRRRRSLLLLLPHLMVNWAEIVTTWRRPRRKDYVLLSLAIILPVIQIRPSA